MPDGLPVSGDASPLGRGYASEVLFYSPGTVSFPRERRWVGLSSGGTLSHYGVGDRGSWGPTAPPNSRPGWKEDMG